MGEESKALLEAVTKLFKNGDIPLGNNYMLQLVPVFSPGSASIRYRYEFSQNPKWKSVGQHTILELPNGSFRLELWQKQ